MGTKWFCDCCGNEIFRNYIGDRVNTTVQVAGTKVLVEVILGIDKVWNSGDICIECTREALKKAV